MPTVLFLHGLESGPHGSKYQALLAAGFNVIAPDCTGISDLNKRVEIAKPYLAEADLVVGSSFGGICALLAAMESKVWPKAMLLCAPALSRAKIPLKDLAAQSSCPVVILHGTKDDVVPFSQSVAYAELSGCELVEVDDAHRLSASTEVMVKLAKNLTGMVG